MTRHRLHLAFLALLLACTFAAAAIPAPKEVLGFDVGEDRKLADWAQVTGYLQKVSAADPARARYEVLGQTTEGKPFVLLTISSADNISRLDRYRDIQKRLADPRGLSDTDAERLIAEGKAVVLITCTIHSTEVASTQAALEFVYRLLTEDTPRNRTILKDAIFLLVPSLNPDGQDMVVQWYRKTVGTPSEGSSPPFLYHKYVGHDNNRDWYMFTQVETRLAVEKVHNVWHPHVVYDVHQMGATAARIFTPPWLDPVEPNIDPLIVSETNMLGTAMAADLATAGKKGVVVNAMYDFWTPARHYQSYHGGLRILTESASARLASPITVRFDQLDTNALGYNAQRASWNFPDPWPGGTWRLRDIIDYQLVTMESCLFHTAQNRGMFLRNFYRIGRNAVEPRPDRPYAYVIPPGQRDAATTARMLNVLRFGMVEIESARKSFTAGAVDYPAGSYVIRLAQPYGPWAKTMLERQRYPDLRMYPGGPPRRPYDVTAHTLPLLMGVNAVEVQQPFETDLEKIETDIRPAAGSAPASASSLWKLSPQSNAAFQAVNRLLKRNAPVSRDGQGNFIVRASQAELQPLASELGVTFDPVAAMPQGARPLRTPRVAIYKSYVPSMDEGWTRYVLEQFEFPYTTVHDKDLRDGKLNDRFDVVLIADMSVSSIVNGQPCAGRTAPGAGSGGRPSLPMPAEFCAGIGEAGVRNLKDFATRGGTLVLLNRATAFAIERLDAGASNILSSVSSRDFYAPGSLLRIRLDTSHPLAWGMEPEAAAWFEHGPAFEPAFQGGDGMRPVASFPDGNPLMSGWLLGDSLIQKRHVIVEAKLGSGRALLFGIRPQYRAQSHGTYKLLFNSLFYF